MEIYGKGMGEAPLSLSVEIFHETRIWSNTKNPWICIGALISNLGEDRGRLFSGGGGVLN